MGFLFTVIFPHKDEVSASSMSFRLANETAFLFALYVLVKLYQLGPCFTIYCTSQSNEIILLFLILCLKGIETVLLGFDSPGPVYLPKRCLLYHKSNSYSGSVPSQFHYLLLYSFTSVLSKDKFLVDCNSGHKIQIGKRYSSYYTYNLYTKYWFDVSNYSITNHYRS